MVGVKFYGGYQPSVRAMLDFANELRLDTPERVAYPPLLPKDMWERSGSDNLVVPGGEIPERTVSYFEPDGKGNWRLCREELWNPTSPANQARDDTYFNAQSKSNPFLRRRGQAAPVLINSYTFDAKGRLIRAYVHSPDARGAPYLYGVRCFRYDERDSILLYVDAKTTKKCPKGEPDDMDEWMKVHNAWVDGQRVLSRVDRNLPMEDGLGWVRAFDFRTIGAEGPNGFGRSDSRDGLTSIIGATNIGQRDLNGFNDVPRTAEGQVKHPLEYHFTSPPVPVSVMDNLETLYQYDRQRVVNYGSGNQRVEWFAAGSNVAANSYIFVGGNVIRHEQRDPVTGKIRRAINVAFEKYAGTSKGMYPEPAIKKPLLLKGHEYYYRVWDYDADGKPTLVAIGWDRGFSKKPVDRANIAFGTPDGKVKWKTREEFLKAFGFHQRPLIPSAPKRGDPPR